jgi:hypothetical protein
MIEQNIREKLQLLISRARAMPHTMSGNAHDHRQAALCERWLTEALNVIELAVPRPNNAYRRRVEALSKGSHGLIAAVHSVSEVFEALLQDIDAGLLGDLNNKITAGIFDDFLDHAEEYARHSRKMEAGVIAGVVFEDTVRRIYRDKIADDKGRSLEDLINALAGDDIITGQQSKQAKVASHVRTKATHAQWDEFDLRGVTDTIGLTRVLLSKHLGG